MGSNPTVTAMRKASISAESRGNRGLRHSPIGTVTGAPETVDRYGRLDVLVNNAAAPQGDDRADIEEVPVSTFDRIVAINLGLSAKKSGWVGCVIRVLPILF